MISFSCRDMSSMDFASFSEASVVATEVVVGIYVVVVVGLC
jgi:hypothetical protein